MRQPKKIAIAYIILEFAWIPLSNDVKGGIPCHYLRF